ncbi:hypothetical protein THAOC_09718 [Thalassiosira oceanica]|uniref:Uncharacterized protein n=1 Tax=Thalassiosira oceanica TaxID=159749 RepID=K0TEU9_THAOC|nr:hypothetical protein THAOC_09718 [Thalassiosira oceanica]|eukprot:EJK69062.1 hypothetical protein THAOC_09718 [Thalassiosira oceanica]
MRASSLQSPGRDGGSRWDAGDAGRRPAGGKDQHFRGEIELYAVGRIRRLGMGSPGAGPGSAPTAPSATRSSASRHYDEFTASDPADRTQRTRAQVEREASDKPVGTSGVVFAQLGRVSVGKKCPDPDLTDGVPGGDSGSAWMRLKARGGTSCGIPETGDWVTG